MKEIKLISQSKRVKLLLDQSWLFCIQKIASGKIIINKEASLQLHYASIIKTLGDVYCVSPSEGFSIELESKQGKNNVDICCSIGETKAAVELKCFRKSSNRATDLDMYDVLKDIARLQALDDFNVRKFMCLTDNPYYSNGAHAGHAGSVTIKNGFNYEKDAKVSASWVGIWKDKSRDRPISFNSKVTFRWNRLGAWYFLDIDT
jgi:hypothetical protein